MTAKHKPDRSSYTALDFREWRAAASLVISPKFQRRPVWSTAQRSYLIDTILRGLPVPPIFLRVRQSDDKKKTVREVIDGQQRISAVLDYLSGEYALSKSVNSAAAGKRFAQLPQDDQDQVSEYPFACELFHGIDDATVLEIFARLNTYAVQLNAQELRNGRYFGHFKKLAYGLALEHLEFWRSNRILTEQNIARMADAELASELVIAQLLGLQDKKKSLDTTYEKYEEAEVPARKDHEKRFRLVLDEIRECFKEDLKDTEFRRRPMFYTLYCVVFHRLFGLPGISAATPKKGVLSAAERLGLRDAVLKLSKVLEDTKSPDGSKPAPPPAALAPFVGASARQTDNLKPRQTRFKILYDTAF